MVRITKIHLEVVPRSILQNSHVPWPGYRIRELPHDVESFFVGKPIVVGLQYGIAALPQMRTQCMQRVPTVFSFRSLQVLKLVDVFYFCEEIMEPRNPGLRLAV